MIINILFACVSGATTSQRVTRPMIDGKDRDGVLVVIVVVRRYRLATTECVYCTRRTATTTTAAAAATIGRRRAMNERDGDVRERKTVVVTENGEGR